MALLQTQTAVTQGKSLTTNILMVATVQMRDRLFLLRKSTASAVMAATEAAAVGAVAFMFASMELEVLLAPIRKMLVTVELARLAVRAIPDALSFTTKAVIRCL